GGRGGGGVWGAGGGGGRSKVGGGRDEGNGGKWRQRDRGGPGVAPATLAMKPARSTAGTSADGPLRPNQYDGSMRPIPLGAKGTFTLRVTPAHLANQFKDAMLPPVFATPMMILSMHNA